MKSLGSQISELRKSRKMTQDELAIKMNVSSQAVSKWENNLSIPDLPILIELADFFHISLDELVRPSVERVSYIPEEQRKPEEELFLRILVLSAEGDKVKLNLPFKIVRMAVEMGLAMPQISGNAALEGIDFNMILTMIDQGVLGKLIEVESADGDIVEIVVE